MKSREKVLGIPPLNRERNLTVPEMRSAYPLGTIIDLCLTTEKSELFDPGETSNHKQKKNNKYLLFGPCLFQCVLAL